VGKVVVIRQNTEQANIMGLEAIKRSMFPNTEVGFSVPYLNGTFRHNLSTPEKKIVQDYYGVTFESEKGKEFYSSLVLKIPTGVYTLDLDDPEKLLFYKVTLGNGAIAKDMATAKSPMCKSLFYYYDQEEEEKVVAEENSKLTEAIISLSKLKEKQPQRLVILAKYLLRKNNFTTDSAFNAISAKIVKDAKKFIDVFNNALKTDEKLIKTTVQVIEAVDRGILKKNKSSQYFNPISGIEYGRNIDEIVTFLIDPKNSDELGAGTEKDKLGSLHSLLK